MSIRNDYTYRGVVIGVELAIAIFSFNQTAKELPTPPHLQAREFSGVCRQNGDIVVEFQVGNKRILFSEDQMDTFRNPAGNWTERHNREESYSSDAPLPPSTEQSGALYELIQNSKNKLVADCASEIPVGPKERSDRATHAIIRSFGPPGAS